MFVLAHFTPAELPGTVAILLLGAVMGIGLARDQRVVVLGSLLFAIFATLSALADGLHWATGIRVAIDVVAVLGALVLVRALWLSLPEHVRR